MIERRIARLDLAEFIVTRDDETGEETIGFTGHAAVFNQPTLIGSRRWGFVEKIRAGAFADVLARDDLDVKFLHNHNPDLLLARSTVPSGPGSLWLKEDKTGLAVDADFVPTTFARELGIHLEHRTITQMSFAFDMDGGEAIWRDVDGGEYDGMEEREIIRFGHLYDVSTVTYPAYGGTDAALRGGVSEQEVRDILSSREQQDDEQLARRLAQTEAYRSLGRATAKMIQR